MNMHTSITQVPHMTRAHTHTHAHTFTRTIEGEHAKIAEAHSESPHQRLLEHHTVGTGLRCVCVCVCVCVCTRVCARGLCVYARVHARTRAPKLAYQIKAG